MKSLIDEKTCINAYSVIDPEIKHWHCRWKIWKNSVCFASVCLWILGVCFKVEILVILRRQKKHPIINLLSFWGFAKKSVARCGPGWFLEATTSSWLRSVVITQWSETDGQVVLHFLAPVLDVLLMLSTLHSLTVPAFRADKLWLRHWGKWANGSPVLKK